MACGWFPRFGFADPRGQLRIYSAVYGVADIRTVGKTLAVMRNCLWGLSVNPSRAFPFPPFDLPPRLQGTAVPFWLMVKMDSGLSYFFSRPPPEVGEEAWGHHW